MLLAVFPLQLVLFPGETLPLHIFEPRYKQLIEECRDEGIHFGMPTFMNGQLSQYGTEAELIKIFRTYDNGEMDVLVRGLRVFRVESVRAQVPDKLYSGAVVSYPENDSDFDETVRARLVSRLETLMRLRDIEIDLDTLADADVSFRIAPMIDLTLPQKIEIVSTLREGDRQELLLKHVESLIRKHRKPFNPDATIGRRLNLRDLRASRN